MPADDPPGRFYICEPDWCNFGDQKLVDCYCCSDEDRNHCKPTIEECEQVCHA